MPEEEVQIGTRGFASQNVTAEIDGKTKTVTRIITVEQGPGGTVLERGEPVFMWADQVVKFATNLVTLASSADTRG